MLVLVAAWLIVIGYGLWFVGYQNWRGQSVGFLQAFWPSGLGGKSAAGVASAGATGGGQLV